ncbi:hypothetical protein T8K17_08380 [Thalassobaculum sp. OXR-137]|uniref:hypothetical protein n=1 Tax=Thalassobaculum sp. OXR-137 TaxID=3100173 RepID=UPI002AC8F779|nr:hypothetical protein [Thalassobaculum sp. OXR-137]WPZ36151.1 hypothetical protein T8K17_08380 [Thalassobaculum sp. OXR-137]
MRDTYVLTPLEAAEQTGLDLDTILNLAATTDSVAETNGETLRIDPWALATAANGVKLAA